MELRKHERLYSEKELVGYLRYSGGAIEVHETYVVFYKNFLPLSKFVKGRSSIIINYSDIKSLEYRGCGWFPGWFTFSFKHFLRPLRFMFYRNHFLFLLKRSKKLNKQMEPLYRYIANKVMTLWDNENYRKIETISEITASGKCPVCGRVVDENKSFCGNCGTKLK